MITILVYSAFVFWVLFVAWTCNALNRHNRWRAERVKKGDPEAARFVTTIYCLRMGRYGLYFGDGLYGCKGIRRSKIDDPARIVDGKPVVVGHGIYTKHFHLSWGLKWPYPWTDVPEVWRRRLR